MKPKTLKAMKKAQSRKDGDAPVKASDRPKNNRHNKSISDSKNKKAFNKRSEGRIEKDQKRGAREKFVDKRVRAAKKTHYKTGNDDLKDADEVKDVASDMNSDDNSDAFDEEMKQVDQELAEIDSDNNNEEEFNVQGLGGELDLPSEEGDEDMDEEDQDMDSGSDDDFDEYCKNIGVDPEDLKDEKPSKKSQDKKPSSEVTEKKKSARSLLVDKMLDSCRKACDAQDSSMKPIKRVIQFVKQVFTDTTDQGDEKEEGEAAKKQNFIGTAINSAEYLKLLQFFTGELPKLMLQAMNLNIKLGKHKVDMKKSYGHMTAKQGTILQSFAANLTRLLSDAMNESSGATHLSHFYQDPTSIVACVLPFKVYKKKLGIQASKTVAMYAKLNNQTVCLLAFQCLNNLVHAVSEDDYFELVMKKLYNEFTHESKVGGGSLLVQDSLRVTQNCIVELLSLNRSIGYQLGFQYIRQLCLHLRTIRNSLTPDSLKQIYSWQFYNCMKVWVLALTCAQTSDLVLLVHPLVQLIIGTMRLTTNLKYFPFHLKCFELLTQVNQKTGLFVPAPQYIMHVFDTVNYNYFNAKPKPMTDKIVPDFFVCLKISKAHMPTQEIKDRIVKESIDALTHWFAANAGSLSFPEMCIPSGVMVRKFKKTCSNSTYKKSLTSLLDLCKRNEEVIAAERAKLRDKSLKDPAKLTQQFALQITLEKLPLVKESANLMKRQTERVNMKISAITKN